MRISASHALMTKLRKINILSARSPADEKVREGGREGGWEGGKQAGRQAGRGSVSQSE